MRKAMSEWMTEDIEKKIEDGHFFFDDQLAEPVNRAKEIFNNIFEIENKKFEISKDDAELEERLKKHLNLILAGLRMK